MRIGIPFICTIENAHVCNHSTFQGKQNSTAFTKYLYLFCYIFGHCLRWMCVRFFPFFPFHSPSLLFVMDTIFYRHIQCCRIPHATQLFATYDEYIYIRFLFVIGLAFMFSLHLPLYTDFLVTKMKTHWELRQRQRETNTNTPISSGIDRDGRWTQQQLKQIHFVYFFIFDAHDYCCVSSLNFLAMPILSILLNCCEAKKKESSINSLEYNT